MGKCFKIFLEELKLFVDCILYPWNVERRKTHPHIKHFCTVYYMYYIYNIYIDIWIYIYVTFIYMCIVACIN